MYTNEHQTYTSDEQAIKTHFVADALIRAYEGMTEGSVAAITFHIQTVHKASMSVHAEHTIVDSGDRLESGILTVMYGNSRVSVTDGYNGPHILLEWFKDMNASAPMTELMMAVDPRAVTWSISDVIDSIEVDDGLDESDLLDWYSDVCSSELYVDITDDEQRDME